MKNNTYVNKTVIRKNNTPKEFTTVHHSILNDKRLTSTAFRILTSILSDSDNFQISYSLFENRFKLAKKTVKAAFDNLEQCGYVIRKPKSRGLYYTISEFGNLKVSVEKTSNNQEDNKEDFNVENENTMLKIEEYLDKYEEFVNFDSDLFLDKIDKHFNSKTKIDFYAFKEDAEDYFTQIRQLLVEHYSGFITELDEHYSKSAIKQYKEWLIDEINTKNNTLNDNICKIMWNQIKSRNFKLKTDYETAMQDKAEQDYYDNQ